VPVRVAVVEAVTELVDTVKVAVVLPAATVTEVGTVAEAVLLESETNAPPVGAAPLRVTVPVVEAPPLTLVGFVVTETRDTLATGVTVSVVVLLTLL
jgi:hypothetical protein